jgi:hypothetical protein
MPMSGHWQERTQGERVRVRERESCKGEIES